MCFKSLMYALLLVMVAGCKSNNVSSEDNFITVSIDPLRYVTERITGDKYEIYTVVPKGASTESYEPNPSSLKKVAKSKAFISVGLLETELNIINFIEDKTDIKSIELYKDVELLESEECGCGHHHHHHGSHSASESGDPHIWLGIENSKIIAESIKDNLIDIFPQDKEEFETNYKALIEDFNSISSLLNERLESLQGKSVLVYHPFLAYLASEGGFTQIAIEQQGKEPSAKMVKEIVERAREKKVEEIFYQSQFSDNSVKLIAKELNLEIVEIDPLEYNHVENLKTLINRISNND